MRPQTGAILWLVLPFLALLSALVMQSSQLILLEQRASTNLQQRRQLDHLARQALTQAEQQVSQLDQQLSARLSDPASNMAWYASAEPDETRNGWFQATCSNLSSDKQYWGLCQPQPRIWEQTLLQDGQIFPLLHPNGRSRTLSFFPPRCLHGCTSDSRYTAWAWSQPHYIVELIDPSFQLHPSHAQARLYRITLRIWGPYAQPTHTWQSWWTIGPDTPNGQQLSIRKIEYGL